MYVEPQIVTTLLFNKLIGDELYSRKWCKYECVIDPNRRVIEHIYTGWDRKADKKVEIRY